MLYEELAHHKLTYGNILDQSKFNNRKFENYARRYGYEAALPLHIIVEAHNYGISNLYELAEYVQLSEEYIAEILKHYKNKYGIGTHYGNYAITFEPLRVFKYKNRLRRKRMEENYNQQKQWEQFQEYQRRQDEEKKNKRKKVGCLAVAVV